MKLIRRKKKEPNRWFSSLKELTRWQTWLFCIFFLISYLVMEKYFVFRVNLARPIEILVQFTDGWEEVTNLGNKVWHYSNCVFSVAIVMLQMAAIYYGPVTGGLLGVAGAILNYTVIRHQPIAPLFVVHICLGQIICGMILYKRRQTFPRVVMANFIFSFYISIPYRVAVFAMAQTHYIWMNIVKEMFQHMVQLPVICVLLYIRILTTGLVSKYFREYRAGNLKMPKFIKERRLTKTDS